MHKNQIQIKLFINFPFDWAAISLRILDTISIAEHTIPRVYAIEFRILAHAHPHIRI